MGRGATPPETPEVSWDLQACVGKFWETVPPERLTPLKADDNLLPIPDPYLTLCFVLQHLFWKTNQAEYHGKQPHPPKYLEQVCRQLHGIHILEETMPHWTKALPNWFAKDFGKVYSGLVQNQFILCSKQKSTRYYLIIFWNQSKVGNTFVPYGTWDGNRKCDMRFAKLTRWHKNLHFRAKQTDFA